MESQPQNPEFRNNPENFHPCESKFNPVLSFFENTVDPEQLASDETI